MKTWDDVVKEINLGVFVFAAALNLVLGFVLQSFGNYIAVAVILALALFVIYEKKKRGYL